MPVANFFLIFWPMSGSGQGVSAFRFLSPPSCLGFPRKAFAGAFRAFSSAAVALIEGS